MSIPRYSINPLWWNIPLMDDHNGKLCEYRDYAKLEAENATLKSEIERLTAIVGADAIDREHGMCCDASAQVERLTKAGDAFSDAMDRLATFSSQDAWLMARMASLAFKDARNAAKEGETK